MKLQSLLEAIKEGAPADAVYGIFANGKDMTARFSDEFEAKSYMRELAKKNPKVSYEIKKASPKKIEEGEERSIIQQACIETLICLLYTSPSPRDQRG